MSLRSLAPGGHPPAWAPATVLGLSAAETEVRCVQAREGHLHPLSAWGSGEEAGGLELQPTRPCQPVSKVDITLWEGAVALSSQAGGKDQCPKGSARPQQRDLGPTAHPPGRRRHGVWGNTASGSILEPTRGTIAGDVDGTHGLQLLSPHGWCLDGPR